MPENELPALAKEIEAHVVRAGGADRGRRIALVGLRGAGKSTLGRMLAQHLGWPFIELDRRVEEEYGASIPDLIEMAGTATFRRHERDALDRVIAEHEAADHHHRRRHRLEPRDLRAAFCAAPTRCGSRRGRKNI